MRIPLSALPMPATAACGGNAPTRNEVMNQAPANAASDR
jgi:hypothetical protein